MKKLLLIFLTSIPFLLSAQHTELGLFIGGSNYMGDLARNSRQVYLKETRPALGVFGRYNMNDFLSFKLAFNYASVSGEDANADDLEVQARNLSFRSSIFELGLTGEINLSGFQPYALSRTFSPYLFIGINAFWFDPQTKYEGEWVNLQPIGTEGQGMTNFAAPYQRTSFAIPFGFGLRYALNDLWNIGLEIGARRTFTDYLDDVSGTYVSYPELLAGNGTLAAALGNRTGEFKGGEPALVETGTPRGDDAKVDWYFVFGITVSYNFLDNGLMGSRNRSRRKSGCRTN